MSSSTARICCEQVEARELRHHQVEHDQVEHLVADPLDRERRIGERRDLEALGEQEVLQVLADVLIVVDDQDRQLRRSSQRYSSCHHRPNHTPKRKPRGGLLRGSAG